jgi:hypothetical protein
MADYLVLRSDDAGVGITLRYAVALALAFVDAVPAGTREELAGFIGEQVDATRWRDATDTWRVVPGAEDLSGFRLPAVAGQALKLIGAMRREGVDLARSDARETLHRALVQRLEREEERLRQEQGGSSMSPTELSAALGDERLGQRGEEMGHG